MRLERGAVSSAARGLCLFGAAGDTWNLGVAALMESVIAGVASEWPDATLAVFDNGFGTRSGEMDVGGRRFRYRRQGVRDSRRLHRTDSAVTIYACGRIGVETSVLRSIQASIGVLDISGGDSFTDLYGPRRFKQILMHKRIALSQRRPLVLLPQTYGPFRSERARRAAADTVGRADQAWARDPLSYSHLIELLGDRFDPSRHRLGVDVAFALPTDRCDAWLPPQLRRWLRRDRRVPVFGINVSGMIYLDPGGDDRFGLRAPYRKVVNGLLDRVLSETDARVILIPHVVAPIGHPQSDEHASRLALSRLDARCTDRVVVAPRPPSASKAKSLISQLDWFCGTRMHSTIAALSSGIATTGLAYSDKMEGVFELAGCASAVTDLRRLDAHTVLDRLSDTWRADEPPRAATPQQLEQRARAQLGDALEILWNSAERETNQ